MKKSKISIKADKKAIPLDKYAGKWVAFVDGKIVECGKTLKSLMRKIEKVKLTKKPSVFLVPKKSEGPYYTV
jgi:hypothetical protein